MLNLAKIFGGDKKRNFGLRGLGLPVPFFGDDEVGDGLPQILPLDNRAMKPTNEFVGLQTNKMPVDEKGLPVIGAPEPNSFGLANRSPLTQIGSGIVQQLKERNSVTVGDDGLPVIEYPTAQRAPGIDASKIFSNRNGSQYSNSRDLPQILPPTNDDERLPLSNLPKGDDALKMLMPQEMPGRPVSRIAPNAQTDVDLREAWRTAEQDLYNASNKDYSITKNPETGEVIRGKDRDKSWSFWDKVGSTLLGALTGFGQGGIVGAIGGGVKAGTDRNYFEKLQVQMSELPKAQARAKEARTAYEASLKLNGAENDETRAWRDDWRKSQKALEDSHKAFLESLLQDDVFDDNDAKAYEEMTGQKIAPFDNRKRQTVMRNGDTFESAETVSGGAWKPSVGVPTELIKKPIGVQQINPDNKPGMVVPMLPKDAVNFTYRADKDAATAQAQIEKDDRREVVEAEKITFKSVAEWRKAQVKASGDFKAAQAAIRGLNPTIAEIEQQIKRYSGTIDPATGNVVGGYDTSDLEKRLDAAKKQQAKYQEDSDKASEIMKVARPQKFSLPARNKKNTRRGSYSTSYIDSVINQ